MPRKYKDSSSEEPPRKKSFTIPDHTHVDIGCGEVLTDISGKEWKLDRPIGLGGFGIIHKVSEVNSNHSDNYVVKIEEHNSGPLFTEINCYLRIGREDMIKEWKTEKCLSSLGMPNYVASGSHTYKDNKYRFLVLPRYREDLEKILEEKKKFNLKTVLLISSQILHVLEYIHSKGYIHSDIKAANIMVDVLNVQKTRERTPERESNSLSSFSKSPVSDSKSRYPRLRTCRARKLTTPVPKPNKRYDTRKRILNYDEELILSNLLIEERLKLEEKRKRGGLHDVEVDQVYLLDFGLASKYKLSSGEHKKCEDERKAHAGTILFCSRDAHRGMPSRRSDLESLAYNMVYWLTGSLPWMDDLENPEMIQRKKRHCFVDPLGFLYFCMPDPPRILKEFFQLIKSLDVQDTPDYKSFQEYIHKAMREHGYKDDGKFDFDNLEGWDIGKKKVAKKIDVKVPLDEFKRPPLLSNMPIKPLLRKKIKTKKAAAALNWSRMLSDPEVLLKKVRDRRIVETNDPIFLNFNIEDMNPTYAMREIYQKYEERRGQSPKGYEEVTSGDFPEGYTPVMLSVWQKMIERQIVEEAVKPTRRGRKLKKVPKKTTNNNYLKDPPKSRTKTTPLTRTYCLRG